MNINVPNKEVNTALIIAVSEEHTSIIDELLTYYPHRLTAIHLNHRNKDGLTALSIAHRQGYTLITEALRKHGVVD
jgi:ankyrin repeat protein